MRRCKIASGCKLPDKPCCTDCEDLTCQNRCWNSPKRCNCWEDAPPRKKRARKVSPLQVTWLYAQGFGQQEIARRLGHHRHTVANILREMGAAGDG